MLAVDIIGSGTVRVLPGTPVVATWGGRFNLYRTSAFSTQATFIWCAPASVQMMLNLDRHASDHSSSRQRIYYDYGRARRANLFTAPGLDPQAWMLVLNRYGTVKYHIVTSRSLATLLRTVATRIRLTGSPAGLVVGSGSHAWVVQGFSATRDPAKGAYTLRGFYTMGPLWPKQTRTHGYFDLPPNTYLTVATMARLTGTYRDPEGHTKWDGLYVAIVP